MVSTPSSSTALTDPEPDAACGTSTTRRCVHLGAEIAPVREPGVHPAAVAASLLCGLALTACERGPGYAADGPTRPHVVLVVIDTLRADHLGVYGYPRNTSPHIDALAARGVVFRRATSPSSWTRPAVGSLMTSLYPTEHAAVSAQHGLDPQVSTLAERFRAAGYRTIGVCGNFAHITDRAGFARGFDHWSSPKVVVDENNGDAIWAERNWWGVRHSLRALTGAELNREVFQRIPPARERPIFLYVHYMDPHSGYLPPSPYRERFLRDPEFDREQPAATSDWVRDTAAEKVAIGERGRERLLDLYDGEIASVDAAFGELMAHLEERGYPGNTVYAVVSDHGEEFAEHGGWFHGLTLYRESLAVPLVLFDSRADAVGATVDTPVDLLDLPTTLIALAGLRPDPRMRGRALGADGRSPAPRPLLAELHRDPLFEGGVRPRSHRWAFTRWPWKVIVHRAREGEFFRLDRDPGEREVLGVEDGAPAELFREGRALIRKIVEPRRTDTFEALGSDAREALEALGYLR